MSDRITARVATREAWKRNYGKYPMDDPGLKFDQRLADQDVAYMLQLQERIAAMEARIAELEPFVVWIATPDKMAAVHNGNYWVCPWCGKPLFAYTDGAIHIDECIRAKAKQALAALQQLDQRGTVGEGGE